MDRRRVAYLPLLTISLCSVFTSVSPAAVQTSRTDGSVSKSKRGFSQPVHEGPLVFPTDLERTEAVSDRVGDATFNASPCPDNASFCESANDYPEDDIKKKLKKQPKLLLDILYEEASHNKLRPRRAVLNETYITSCDRTKVFNELSEEIHDRFSPEPEKELCTSTAKIVYPKKAKSKEGVFEFVVNDEEYRQGIRVEICSSPGHECNGLPAHLLPHGYRSSCVQKYISRILVVLNSNSSATSGSGVQGFVTKPFEFPSCCSCMMSMSVSGYNKFGDDDDTTPVTRMASRNTTEKAKRN